MLSSRDDQPSVNPFIEFSKHLAILGKSVNNKASLLKWEALLEAFAFVLRTAGEDVELNDLHSKEWDNFVGRLVQQAQQEPEVVREFAKQYREMLRGELQAVPSLLKPAEWVVFEGGALSKIKLSSYVVKDSDSVMAGILSRYLMLSHPNPFQPILAYFGDKPLLHAHADRMILLTNIVADLSYGRSIKDKLKKKSFTSNSLDKGLAIFNGDAPVKGFSDFHLAMSRLKLYDERVLLLRFQELAAEYRYNPFCNLMEYFIESSVGGARNEKLKKKMALFYQELLPAFEAGNFAFGSTIKAYVNKPYMKTDVGGNLLMDVVHNNVALMHNIAVYELSSNQFRFLLRILEMYSCKMQGLFFEHYQSSVSAGLPAVNLFSRCQFYLDSEDNRSSKLEAKKAVFQKILAIMQANPDDLVGELKKCLREAKYIPAEKASIFDGRLHTGVFADYIKKMLFFGEAELRKQYQYHQVWLANGKQNNAALAPEPVEPVNEPTSLRSSH